MVYENGSRILVWKIKNFFAIYGAPEKLESPDLYTETDNSKWMLRLLPSFKLGSILEYDRCDLCKVNTSNNSEEIMVSSNLSIVCADGTLAFFQEKVRQPLSKGKSVSFQLVFDKKILIERKKYFVPKDVLTLRCCVMEINPVVISTGCSHVNVDNISQLWKIDNFSVRSLGMMEKFPLIEDTLKAFQLEVEFYLKGDNLDSSFIQTIIKRESLKSDINSQFSLHCRISVLNAEGTVQHSVEARHSFVGKISDSWEMPKLMDRSDLLAENEKCSIDVLALQVEFIVCENKNNSLPLKIERICAKNDIGKHVCNLSNDMRILFNSQKHSDITLRSADGKCVKAVKAILSARSVVFNAMFETDMRENTLDNIHNHKIAVKLYIAADKYQILQLKDLCSNHLSSVASTTNVFDIMYLSSKYQDENLKSAARKLISNDVLNSYRWENFMLEKAPSVKEIDCTNLDETTSNVISPTRNKRKRKISEKRKT
ncbi:speckle-type POZ protein [Trichonephila inaurata madagascariensis]|uniref:Speckle-type POZ protein n=1 Tax=Trichonephila inaurata madagascariensis TaxID=2747483 RepID=A0A8X6XNC7_9ARAC|nr:speckle-type POZ protein [Trichonephila inaurata madagascariensis]